MADITNTEAIAFAATLRSAADQLVALYDTAKRVEATWNARGYSSILTNDASPVIDGRSPAITGAKAVAIVTRLQEFVTDMEASSKAKLNTVLQVAPNP